MRLTASGTRLVAWFALGCHLLVASGVALPLAVAPTDGAGDAAARLAAKDRSRPFPCMDKACGCVSAEQCFAGCCCHTPSWQLAWARAHGVEPAVLAALERRASGAAPSTAGCRADRAAEPACCETQATAESPSIDGPDVCSAYRSLAAKPAATPAPASPPDTPAGTPPRVVILRDMLACGGIATAWLACGTALPPPPRIEPPAHDAPAGAIAARDECAASAFMEPSAPPPRVG